MGAVGYEGMEIYLLLLCFCMLMRFYINTSNLKCYCIFIFAVIFDSHLYFSTAEYKIITMSFILNNQQITDECLLQQFLK